MEGERDAEREKVKELNTRSNISKVVGQGDAMPYPNVGVGEHGDISHKDRLIRAFTANPLGKICSLWFSSVLVVADCNNALSTDPCANGAPGKNFTDIENRTDFMSCYQIGYTSKYLLAFKDRDATSLYIGALIVPIGFFVMVLFSPLVRKRNGSRTLHDWYQEESYWHGGKYISWSTFYKVFMAISFVGGTGYIVSISQTPEELLGMVAYPLSQVVITLMNLVPRRIVPTGTVD